KLLSPIGAKEELFLVFLSRSSNYLSLGTVKGKKTLQANFKNFKIEGAADVERQRLVLQALIHLIGLERDKPDFIGLKHCAALESKTLDVFLHEGLEELMIGFCPQIADRDIETIAAKCPCLKRLALSGCSGLRAIASSGLFSGLF